MFRKELIAAGAALIWLGVSAASALALDLPEAKQTKAGLYVTAIEAAEMLNNENVLLIDVRSRAEVTYLGLPVRANKHIPYMVMPLVPEFDTAKGTYKLELNPDFPIDVKNFIAEAGAGPDTAIVLMCRSGSRSARAADLLTDLGYTQVYSIIDGFEGDKAKDGEFKGMRMVNGWKNGGLAWTYKISDAQAYPGDI